jgi:tRNA dimethylallyltransferase
MTNTVFIAGPTAGGKSAAALVLADALASWGGATIINADSMQVYRELRILTARPSPDDQARVPHRLYGVMSGRERCSAGKWAGWARGAIDDARANGRIPIVVGGTGLYFEALEGGLAAIPPIDPSRRAEAEDEFDALGAMAVREALAAIDPVWTARVPGNDRQRVLRAWTVWRATGRPLSAWQSEGVGSVAGVRTSLRFVLMPPRETIYRRCNARFATMVEHGALEEIAALLASGIPEDRPVMKAVGVRELVRHLSGATTLDQAVADGQQATRRYAKRQLTWIRNRMASWQAIDAQFSESFADQIFSFIRPFLLTT